MAATKKSSSKNSARKKQTHQDNGNPSILFLILIVCIVILLVIVILPKINEDAPKETDTVTDTKTAENTEDTYDTENNDTSDTPVTDEKTEEITTAEDIPDETTADIGYTVETEVETQKSDNGGASMEYPTVTPDNDSVDAEFINKLIRDYMDKKMREEQLDGGEGIYQYNITETKTMLMTDDLLSILIMGQYDVSDSPHPTLFAYTINCDLTDNSLIYAEDLIKDFGIIREKFINGSFTLEYGNEGLLFETNYEDMIMEYRTEYGIYPYVFFTEDTFGMVIDLVYALGGYAVFEIPYSEITGAVFEPAK